MSENETNETFKNMTGVNLNRRFGGQAGALEALADLRARMTRNLTDWGTTNQTPAEGSTEDERL